MKKPTKWPTRSGEVPAEERRGARKIPQLRG